MANQLTITNLTNGQVGVAGIVLDRGQAKTMDLSKVQNTSGRAADLAAQQAAGNITVSLNGAALTSDEILTLDAVAPASFAIVKQVMTDVAAADVDGIVTAIAMDAAGLSLSGAALDGAVGGGTMDPPRNITITTTTGGGEAIEGGDAVITGLDVDGNAMSETIAIAALGESTSQVDTGVKCFAQVTNVALPTDSSGTPGDAEVGFGDAFGLTSKLTYGGLLSEHVNNAVPGTAGTIALSGTSAPNGSYTPDTVADGSNDYVLTYAPDA